MVSNQNTATYALGLPCPVDNISTSHALAERDRVGVVFHLQRNTMGITSVPVVTDTTNSVSCPRPGPAALSNSMSLEGLPQVLPNDCGRLTVAIDALEVKSVTWTDGNTGARSGPSSRCMTGGRS